MTERQSYAYRGRNRAGISAVGNTTTTPTEFVKAKFDAGWQQLDVFKSKLDDDYVGHITVTDDGVRIWWANDD